MKTLEPRYNRDRAIDPNYGPGYIGFSYRDNNIFSKGIAIFEREEYSGIVPSHSFIVRDKHKIIEAELTGVCESDVSKYFDDPRIVVFFKKPKDLTMDDVSIILFNAVLHLGRKYDVSLFWYFVLRKALRLLGRFEPYKNQPSWFDSPGEWICSELVAYCLKMVPKYANLFPLSEYHPSKIDPLMLFRSDELFEPWRYYNAKAAADRYITNPFAGNT
jgi:hypothetical protein